MDKDWENFKARLKTRWYTTLDVLSIMVFDAIILVVAPALNYVEALTNLKNQLFAAAREISGGAFLLLYTIWVVFDIWKFLKKSYKEGV